MSRESRGGEKIKLFFFHLPSSRASRKMPRSPRLAHKAPVMSINAGYYNTDLKDQHRGAYQILGCFLVMQKPL